MKKSAPHWNFAQEVIAAFSKPAAERAAIAADLEKSAHQRARDLVGSAAALAMLIDIERARPLSTQEDTVRRLAKSVLRSASAMDFLEASLAVSKNLEKGE